MPPRRSSRTSLSSPTGADDISYLTLAEVRDRLNRNNALLSSPLFAPPQVGAAGPSSDPVKDKLLLAREALLAREQELMLGGMHLADQDTQQQQIYNGSPTKSPTLGLGGGGNGRSGKARVLNRIREGESNLAKNGLILPIDQTLHLGQRDYQNATALSLSHLSLNPTRSSSPKPRSARPKVSHPSNLYDNGPVSGEDEITRANRLARINAFMSYKPSSSDSEDDDDDYDQDEDEDEELEGMEGIDKEEYINRLIRSQSQPEEKNFPLTGNASGGYDGNAQPLHNDDKLLDDLGEEVDVYGEDDEDFLEGNEEYANGAGQGSMAAGPGR